MLIQPNPTQVRLLGYEGRRQELKKQLSYTDLRVDYELKKFKKSYWFIQKYGQAAFDEQLTLLQSARDQSLLFEDEEGLWTYSGLADELKDSLGDQLQVDFKLPNPKLLPWEKVPEKQARYYQTKAKELLLSQKHAAVELGTGLGKSYIALLICKELGLKTVVMAPSISIADQLYEEFSFHFGKKRVGTFYGGKKEINKLFVIGVAQSLTRVKEGSPAWNALSKAEVFIADESHLCPAKTLTAVCFGLCAKASYRFFFSGTQLRNDGLGLLLRGITGPIVYRMTVQEGVDQGFLAKPVFRMVRMQSDVVYDDPDVNNLTRAHLYYSEKVNRTAADIANRAVSVLNRPTLILVEELDQFKCLLPHLRFEARLAQAGADNKHLVDEFNRGAFPILVGTSCISTGTDIRPVQALIYLRGGKSEIEVKQGVGRGTRLVPGKTDCLFFDFAIENIPILAKHAEARRELYREIYPSLKDVTL